MKQREHNIQQAALVVKLSPTLSVYPAILSHQRGLADLVLTCNIPVLYPLALPQLVAEPSLIHDSTFSLSLVSSCAVCVFRSITFTATIISHDHDYYFEYNHCHYRLWALLLSSGALTLGFLSSRLWIRLCSLLGAVHAFQPQPQQSFPSSRPSPCLSSLLSFSCALALRFGTARKARI